MGIRTIKEWLLDSSHSQSCGPGPAPEQLKGGMDELLLWSEVELTPEP